MKLKLRSESRFEARIRKGVCFCNDSPPAPDYTPLANASKESAEVMAAQGDRVLAEGKRQYDKNMEVAAPVVAAQLGIMRQTADQGADYYSYMKDTFRPVEEGLVKDANEFSTEGAREGFARQAAADVAMQQGNARGQAERAMAASGVNPNSGRFAGMNRALTVQNAGARAGATTTARVQADNLGFAKRMDVSGMGRGLPGASTGAYSVATGAGTSAVGNQMAPGAQQQAASIAGAGIYGQGQRMKIGGLSGVLNAQTSFANNQGDDSGIGGIVGAGLGAWAKTGFAGIGPSDRRLKENIIRVSDSPMGVGLYEFNYIGEPDHRYRGVMADEVESVLPDAVTRDDLGFASVNYGMLGIEMVEV